MQYTMQSKAQWNVVYTKGMRLEVALVLRRARRVLLLSAYRCGHDGARVVVGA